MVRLIDRPDMTLDVYRGRKTTMQQKCLIKVCIVFDFPPAVCGYTSIYVFTPFSKINLNEDPLKARNTSKKRK